MEAMLQGFSWGQAWSVFLAVLPAWLFGALVGYLVRGQPTAVLHPMPRPDRLLTRAPAPPLQLPRPKWMSASRAGALLYSTPPGIRRLALLYHAAVICREVWYYFTAEGTFRHLLRRCWLALRGQRAGPAAGSISASQALAPPQYDSW
jgi:hypothetical protein